MPIDPRVQFVSSAARLAVEDKAATRRRDLTTDQLAHDLGEFEARYCTHIPKGLLGKGLACRRCAAHWVEGGHAESDRLLAGEHLDREAVLHAEQAMVAEFGEVWIVPTMGPCAKLPQGSAEPGFASTVIVGVKVDVRAQLGVELRAPDADDSTPVDLAWLLAHGRRVS